MDARGNPAINNESEGVVVNCNCCMSYKEWTQRHPSLAKSLLKAADSILYYRLCPNESVTVVIDGNKYTYTGTIRASTAASKGICIGVASNTGQQPYTCAACYALTRGKVSPLNRIVNRAPTLKHPRSDHTRATKPGVSHKYCSSDHLQTAIQSLREELV